MHIQVLLGPSVWTSAFCEYFMTCEEEEATKYLRSESSKCDIFKLCMLIYYCVSYKRGRVSVTENSIGTNLYFYCDRERKREERLYFLCAAHPLKWPQYLV